jgi:mannobiose 2-epimerase
VRSPRDVPPHDRAALDLIRQDADATLRNHVLPFWVTHGWDATHGGFLLELGPGGRQLGPTDKFLVPQARLVWTLAAAHRHGFRSGPYVELAGRGARFLVDRLWDSRAGGFVWAVTREGKPLHENKRTYGQAFAIYALSEYALASGESWASDWARRALDVLVERAEDGEHGFFEEFDAAWRPVAGPAGRGKSVNVHLHLLEAFTPLAELTGDVQHAVRLRTMLRLVLERGIDVRHHFAINELLERDWYWRPSWRRPIRVSYGHGAELAWLAGLAVDVLGDEPEQIRHRALGLIDHALRYGFDHRRGGIASLGPPVGAAHHAWYLPRDWRAKRWWEQTEMLVATLAAYEWTGAPRYLAAFVRQFPWVRPPRLGQSHDWFDPSTWGSHDWKDPYHGARALMEVSRRLSSAILRP